MKQQLRRLCMSFFYAGRGVWHCVREERNFRIHLVAGVAVLTLAAGLDLSRPDRLWLILCIGGVLAAELVNTAVEALTDLASPARHPLARIAKDAAAAAVLVTALTSAAIGGVILWRPQALLALWRQATPIHLTAIVLSAGLAFWFVFYGGRPKGN